MDYEDKNERKFFSVLSVLKKENLAPLGSAVLQRTKPEYSTVVADPSVGEPLCRSDHVLFPLTFDNGLRWLVRIPINGTDEEWDDLSAASLSSEANTMRLLKRETTIPIPEVLDFSSSTQNSIGCPYILMEFISGISMHDLWFTDRLHGTSSELTRKRRTRALKGVASAMSQLYKYSFEQEGMPVFGDNGEIERIGPMRILDHQATLKWWISHKNAKSDIYVKREASSDQVACYKFMLDRHHATCATSAAPEEILREMITRIPVSEEQHPFVLAHPHLSAKNFIVSEDGELVGIIDWKGVGSMPRSLGNEIYPKWLIKNWKGIDYRYMHFIEEEEAWQDPPETLSYYRGIYNDLMTANRAELGRSSEPNYTRMSLMTGNMALACSHPWYRDPIIKKIALESLSAAGGTHPPPEVITLMRDSDMLMALIRMTYKSDL